MYADTIQLTKLGDHPKIYRERVDPYPNLGWCVLKHKPRDIPAPDETIFHQRNRDDIGNGIPFMEWWNITESINSPVAMEVLLTYEVVFFNNDENPDERIIDRSKPVNIRPSSGGGNLKAYYINTQTPTHIQIVAFDYRFPELAIGKNFYTHPHLFTYPTAITPGGNVFKMSGGVDQYIPQIERPEQGLWEHKADVIFLPNRPLVWSESNVLSSWGL